MGGFLPLLFFQEIPSFPNLFVPLAYQPKVLTLGKIQINLVFLSFFRTSGLSAEGTLARKNPNKFGFSLTYSYLCTQNNEDIEMKQLKAALFDLDGVVFDTEPQYTIFWGSQCRLYHPEHPGLEHEIKGSTLDQIYDRWWNGPLVEERETVTRRLNEFEAQMDYTYIAGLETFIRDLHRNGVKTAVVTSSNMPKMQSV